MLLNRLEGLVAVALFLGAGWGWGELLPAVRRLRAGARYGLYYLLGIGWVAVSLYALSHLAGLPLRRPAIVLLGLLPMLAGAGSRWRRRAASRAANPAPSGAPRHRLLAILVLAIAGLATLGILAEVVSLPLTDWDGRMTWTAQARYVREAGTVDAPVLREGRWFVSHTHYPLLLPVAQVVAMELVGAEDDDPAYRPLYAFFFPAFLALAWGIGRTRGGERAAWLTALTASLLPLLSFYPRGGAVTAYSDLPLACFYGGAVLLLLQPRLDRSSGMAAGLLLAAAVLTKDEGMLLAGVALAVAGATRIWQWRARRPSRRPNASLRRDLLPLGIAALWTVAAIGLLASWRAGVPPRFNNADYAAMLEHQSLPGALARIPVQLARVRKEMASLELWGIFWSLAPLVLLAGRRGLRRRTAPALALAFLAPVILNFFVLLITDDPVNLAKMTWNRFVMQGAIPFLALFAWALAEILRRTPWLNRRRLVLYRPDRPP